VQVVRDIPLALDSLRSNPLRSFLTLFGIAVGIGAVMYVVMLGEAAQASIRSRLEALGANVLIVRPGGSRMRGVSREGSRESLTVQDSRDIEARSRVIDEVVPEFSRGGLTEYQSRNHRTTIAGTIPSYGVVNKHHAARGRWFTEAEVNRIARVVVLGSDVVPELFPNEEAIGKTITLNDIRFEVIGILDSKGSGWRNPDDQVFVPITTAQQRLFGADHITTAYAQVTGDSAIQEAFFDIETTLRRNHRIPEGQPNDFRIRKQDVFLSTVQETNEEVARLIVLIAMVSLIVGGIGIANVMLISVVERTREIGMRRAVGARRRDILGQFLVESGVLGLTGGVIGLVGGAIYTRIALPAASALPMLWVGYSFLICASIGVASGLYPAAKASRLDVIEAIRHE
jgi:putative ABC transport system permease protein